MRKLKLSLESEETVSDIPDTELNEQVAVIEQDSFDIEEGSDVNHAISKITTVVNKLLTINENKFGQIFPGKISEVDVGDENSTANIFKEVKAVDDGTGIMRTGFQGINRMLQGGFRRGDCIVLGASHSVIIYIETSTIK
jgi:hypothetical protein